MRGVLIKIFEILPPCSSFTQVQNCNTRVCHIPSIARCSGFDAGKHELSSQGVDIGLWEKIVLYCRLAGPEARHKIARYIGSFDDRT